MFTGEHQFVFSVVDFVCFCIKSAIPAKTKIPNGSHPFCPTNASDIDDTDSFHVWHLVTWAIMYSNA